MALKVVPSYVQFREKICKKTEKREMINAQLEGQYMFLRMSVRQREKAEAVRVFVCVCARVMRERDRERQHAEECLKTGAAVL